MQKKTEKRPQLKWADSNTELKHKLFAGSSRILKQLLGRSIYKIVTNHNARMTDICSSEYEWKRAQVTAPRNFSQNWMR